MNEARLRELWGRATHAPGPFGEEVIALILDVSDDEEDAKPLDVVFALGVFIADLARFMLLVTQEEVQQ